MKFYKKTFAALSTAAVLTSPAGVLACGGNDADKAGFGNNSGRVITSVSLADAKPFKGMKGVAATRDTLVVYSNDIKENMVFIPPEESIGPGGVRMKERCMGTAYEVTIELSKEALSALSRKPEEALTKAKAAGLKYVAFVPANSPPPRLDVIDWNFKFRGGKANPEIVSEKPLPPAVKASNGIALTLD